MRLVIVPLILAAFLVVGPTAVYANSNQSAAEKIAASLGDRFPGYDIAVSYQNGKVKLVGQVGSADIVNQAVEHVKHVPGIKVTDIDNGLRVTGVAPAALPPVPKNAVIAPVQVAPQVAQNRTSQNRTPQNVTPPEPAKRSIWSPPSQPKQVATAPVPMPTRLEQPPVTQASNQPRHAAQPQYAQPQYTQPQYAQQVNPYAQQYQVPQQPHVVQQQVIQQAVAYQPEAYGPQGPLPGQYNQPNLPEYAWPSYASYPNYAEVCYPKQYSPKAWPYIGPFYPYPQAPLGWRKTTLEWHDGWWWLDFDDGAPNGPFSPLFRQPARYTY